MTEQELNQQIEALMVKAQAIKNELASTIATGCGMAISEYNAWRHGKKAALRLTNTEIMRVRKQLADLRRGLASDPHSLYLRQCAKFVEYARQGMKLEQFERAWAWAVEQEGKEAGPTVPPTLVGPGFTNS